LARRAVTSALSRKTIMKRTFVDSIGNKLYEIAGHVSDTSKIIPNHAFGAYENIRDTLGHHKTRGLALLSQSVYSRLAGYDDTNDAERMSVDPDMRQVVGGRAKERTAASTSLMGGFETEICQPKNPV